MPMPAGGLAALVSGLNTGALPHINLSGLRGVLGPACPADLAALRPAEIASSFDQSVLEGAWFERGYIDVAQAGAHCQTLQGTVREGQLVLDFQVLYGSNASVPFAMREDYVQEPEGRRGFFLKHVEVPVAGPLVQLPTVFLAANADSFAAYSCVPLGPLGGVHELVIAGRTPGHAGADALVQQLVALARKQGVPAEVTDGVKLVSHEGCPAPPTPAPPARPWLHAFADKTMILEPPAGKSGTPAAWIVLPGAQIDMAAYRALAEAVQRKVSMPLWVAVLGTYLTPSPIPPEVGPRIDHVLSAMKDQGLDLDQVKLFYGGHSLGSVFIQDHLYKYHGETGPIGGKIEVLGQVLMGGFIQRKYIYPNWTYPVSTLTIGGELDGLARPTRLAEAYYHSQDKLENFPVAIVKGMTHMQFASGEPPLLVKLRDLQPDIAYEEAHVAVADLVAPYFEERAGLLDGNRLFSQLDFTMEFVKPIIRAYEIEGNRWFNAMDQIGGPGEKNCVKGGCPSKSMWATEAQKVISSVDDWTLSVDSEYVDCSSTPLTGAEFHLPVITNNTEQKTLHITTYSQAYWDDATPSWFDWKAIFDKYDTGFVATSAEEIGTKLASRQCTLIQGLGELNTSFSVDDPQFCAITNKKAYEWAQTVAATASLERFGKYGQKYVFGDDIPKSGGPLFLYARLQFNEKADSSGESVIEVASPMVKTEIDYWTRHFGPIPRPSALPDPGCFHYCKLLSPARAMEWIYIDSLRLKKGLSSKPTAQTILV